jgi:hypothetical protein
VASPSKDPRGIDVRLDPGSRGLPAQDYMCLLNVVALIDQHPDGAIQDG